VSFRRRLVLLSAGAVAVAVIVASVVVYFVVRGELRGDIDRRLRALQGDVFQRRIAASEGAPLVTRALDPGELPREAAGRRVLILPPAPLGGAPGYAQILRDDGSVVGPFGQPPALPVSARVRRVAAGEENPYLTDMHVAGVHVRVLVSRVGPRTAIQVARPLTEVDDTLRRLLLVLLAVSVGGVGAAVLLGRLVTRSAIAPVAALTDAAEHVTRTSDLSRRVEAPGPDELGRLASSFNTMLEALEKSVAAQRRLVADASHELRTPLTSVRTNIEALERSGEMPADERADLLRSVVTQLEELSALVGDLVDLARDGKRPAELEDVRLDLVAQESVDRARGRAPAAQFETRLDPCLVRAVPAQLHRAVDNLVDNALKWSPPGGAIEVAVAGGEVRVRDRGPGIAADDLPLVFDRFYRAADARGTPGSGLGLAIVRQVAESHGGSVAAANAPDGGACLTLRLPAEDLAAS
jgi:two-component system sensor histidine kinase MprB